jgi:hypothetical protein
MQKANTYHRIVHHGVRGVRRVPWEGQSIDREWEFVLVLVAPVERVGVNVGSKRKRCNEDAQAGFGYTCP